MQLCFRIRNSFSRVAHAAMQTFCIYYLAPDRSSVDKSLMQLNPLFIWSKTSFCWEVDCLSMEHGISQTVFWSRICRESPLIGSINQNTSLAEGQQSCSSCLTASVNGSRDKSLVGVLGAKPPRSFLLKFIDDL